MTTPDRLERFQNYIAGKFVDASDGRTFGSLDPYAGAPWAAIPEGTVEDIDHAVAAARSALDGEWGRMTGFQRAALLRRLGDLIGENAERLARVEVRDNGKLYREMIGQLQGLAPGTTTSPATPTRSRAGSSRPTSPTSSSTRGVSRSGGRRDHAVELPAAAHDVQARPGPGRRVHVRRQALRALPRVDAGLRAGAARSGLPGRRVQRRRRVQPRPGGRAGVAQGRRQGRVHRLDRDRQRRWRTPRRTTSTGSPSSWAASRRRSCSRTPTSRRRQRDRRRRVRRDRARPAWPGSRVLVHESVHDELVRLVAAGERDQAGRPERPGDRDGPHREQAAVREGARLPRQGEGRGGDGCVRRHGGRRARRAVRPADPVHRRRGRTTPSSARRSSGRSPRR